MSNGDWARLGERLQLYLIWAVCILVDNLLTGFWAVCEWVFGRLKNVAISSGYVSGFGHVTLGVFEAVFAISTLAPVVAYVFRDIKVIALQARITSSVRPQNNCEGV